MLVILHITPIFGNHYLGSTFDFLSSRFLIPCKINRLRKSTCFIGDLLTSIARMYAFSTSSHVSVLICFVGILNYPFFYTLFNCNKLLTFHIQEYNVLSFFNSKNLRL